MYHCLFKNKSCFSVQMLNFVRIIFSSGRFSGKRKVAKVMPYSGPYEEANLVEGDQDQDEDPLAISSEDRVR